MNSYLIVGSGLFGSVFAEQLANRGSKVKVIDKRNHIGGNIYTKNIDGIQVHEYGAHIFHTSNKKIWDYINQYADFNSFINSPIAFSKGNVYNLPFNMNTFNSLWAVTTPEEAKRKIIEQTQKYITTNPNNLEEQALSIVGKDIYETLIKEYTEKQWGMSCSELPSFLIKRLPIRFTYNNNYFDDLYQGIPLGGYTNIIKKMLNHSNIDIQLSTDFKDISKEEKNKYNKIIYTGMIDEYFDYCYGKLDYRSLRFEHELLPQGNFQGNAVVNYIDKNIPYTRIVEHKHFENDINKTQTIITREYPKNWQLGEEPYYPINNKVNQKIYNKYNRLALNNSKVIFGGRLGKYSYYNMDQVIEEALKLSEIEIFEAISNRTL